MGEDKQRTKAGWLWLLFRAFLVTLVDSGDSKSENNGETPMDEVTPQPDDELAKVGLPRNLPSIIDIKRALPAHCFDAKVSTSMSYVVKDVIMLVALHFLGEWSWEYLPPSWQVVLTPLYWLLQGTLFTAIFVLGHDCGHGSFSHHELLNDVIGTLLHTFLMAPYYGWKLSHRHHHKNTGNIDKDEVFFPVRKKYDDKGSLMPGFGLGVGWYAYIVKGYKPRGVNHFNPWEPMYRRHILGVSLSVITMALWGCVLYQYYQSAGLWKLVYHWGVPDFIFASYTVIITFLHHTEMGIAWYADDQWDNVRGQLSSVDRHYGWCHDLIHNIGTHQIHHLFPKVPHYHLEEATGHFRRAFPELVQTRDDRILPAFWRMFCKYAKQCVIPDETRLHLYK